MKLIDGTLLFTINLCVVGHMVFYSSVPLLLQWCGEWCVTFVVAGVSEESSSAASSVPPVNQAPSSSPPTPVESQLGIY